MAMTQRAIAAERARLGQAQNIHQADLQAQELGMREQKMGRDYELGKKELDLKGRYYDIELRRSRLREGQPAQECQGNRDSNC